MATKLCCDRCDCVERSPDRILAVFVTVQLPSSLHNASDAVLQEAAARQAPGVSVVHKALLCAQCHEYVTDKHKMQRRPKKETAEASAPSTQSSKDSGKGS